MGLNLANMQIKPNLFKIHLKIFISEITAKLNQI